MVDFRRISGGTLLSHAKRSTQKSEAEQGCDIMQSFETSGTKAKKALPEHRRPAALLTRASPTKEIQGGVALPTRPIVDLSARDLSPRITSRVQSLHLRRRWTRLNRSWTKTGAPRWTLTRRRLIEEALFAVSRASAWRLPLPSDRTSQPTCTD